MDTQPTAPEPGHVIIAIGFTSLSALVFLNTEEPVLLVMTGFGMCLSSLGVATLYWTMIASRLPSLQDRLNTKSIFRFLSFFLLTKRWIYLCTRRRFKSGEQAELGYLSVLAAMALSISAIGVTAYLHVAEIGQELVTNLTDAEQDGADQPATALESKPEGKEKPKPESEGRSQ